MGNTLVTLQTFTVSPNIEFGLYSTNVLKRGQIYIVLKEKIGEIEYETIFTEEEALKLFNVYAFLKNTVDGCELYGALLHCFSRSDCRSIYVKIVRNLDPESEDNNTYYVQWEVVFLTGCGKIRYTPITLICLTLLSGVRHVLINALEHWKNKMKVYEVRNVLGIRDGVHTLVEECRWTIFGKLSIDGLLNVRPTIQMCKDMSDVLCTWGKRDEYTMNGNE